MKNYTSKAWRQYEAGKQHKSRIGLYEKVKQNEAFYRGEQWQSGEGTGLSKPVFNIVKRIVDYLVSSVASSNVSIHFTDENLPFDTPEQRKQSESLLDTLNKSTAYRWESGNMDNKIHRVLTDAVISGDGAFYCYWNPQAKGAGGFEGDIVTDLLDSACIFPADVNSPDIQSQEYIIISGRASVGALRHEARRNGVSEDKLKQIVSDSDTELRAGALCAYELECDDENEKKATFIIKFWRENGKVCFEKSTRECVIKRAVTDCTLYPVAFFNWSPTKDSFHGTSPISGVIANQKFINRAFAMCMKHMTDTAFSKIIYDKSKIPEWTNEVGEAIAAMGGGNISDSVSVIRPGELQDGFMELVERAISLTKELAGATDSALGNLEATNTSAILALQASSRIPLDSIRFSLYGAIEELADIWADMVCAYCPPERLLPCIGDDGVYAQSIDTELLRDCMLTAKVDVTEVTRYSTLNAQLMLDKLLEGNYISIEDYIRRLPAGLIMDRQALIEDIQKAKVTGKETECG